MDKLEKYIRERRDSLDLYEPSPELWESIDQGNARKGFPGRSSVLKWAAAIALLAATSIILLGITSNITVKITMGAAGEELRETETYYATRVSNLMKEAEPLFTANPALGEELQYEMESLDSIYAEIKSDLRENVNNAEVIEALIGNYRTRIRILEELLMVLKEDQNNNEKGTRNEI